MIDGMVNRMVEDLIENKLIAEEQRDEYEYTIFCGLESLITIGSVIILSLLLNDFLQTICFLLTFLSLRKRAGGYHINSFAGCYLGTIIIYLIVYVISKGISSYKYLYIYSVIACIIIIMIGAVNHPNMNFSNQEYIRAKTATRSMACLVMALIVFMRAINIDFSIVVLVLASSFIASVRYFIPRIPS